MRKELTPIHELAVCEVCARTILKGERTEPYVLPDGSMRQVCDLCVRRAEGAGWIRETAHRELPAGAPRAEQRRSILSRLRRRGNGPGPAALPGSEGGELLEEPAAGPAAAVGDGADAVPGPEPDPATAADRRGGHGHDAPEDLTRSGPAYEDAGWEDERYDSYGEPPYEGLEGDGDAPHGGDDDLTHAERGTEADPTHAYDVEPAPGLDDEEPYGTVDEAEYGADESYADDSYTARPGEALPFDAPSYEAPSRRRERRARRRVRDPRQVRAIPTGSEAKVERALEIFNASEYQRTVAGLARTLGEPWGTALPLIETPSEVTIVVAWELSWYQYRVDLSDTVEPVALLRKGTELGELETELREWNVALDSDGVLVPGAAA